MADGNFSISDRTLANFSKILRDRSLWPTWFVEWDYGDCGKCAMGLACAVWGGPYPCALAMAQMFSFPLRDAKTIFLGAHHILGVRFSSITPENIADLIDRRLQPVVLHKTDISALKALLLPGAKIPEGAQ
jgi:hypothetical protein